MAKKIEMVENRHGGYDLLTEKDAGNEVLITTGKLEKSLDFWMRLSDICEKAIIEVGCKVKIRKGQA